MQTVVRGNKSTSELRRIREKIEKEAKSASREHKQKDASWHEGEPVIAWYNYAGDICIEYESGKTFRYDRFGMYHECEE